MTRQFLVLGGAGVIGRVVVRDLFTSHRHNRITVADFNLAAARQSAKSYRSRRVRAALADATQPVALAKLLRGHAVVINCTQHTFNLRVMEAALRARVHYVDLGGLFVWTRRQRRWHRRFERAGLVAVLGMGCAPGITNVMTRALAAQFEKIDAVKIRVGSFDPYAAPGAFGFPYSAQTIVEELTLKPWVYQRGQFRQVPARSGWERVDFPPPLGKVWTVCTRHSEVATIPLSFPLRRCDFKVSFDRAFVRELVTRLRAGWTVKDFAKLPVARTQPMDYEIARVTMTGRDRAGAPATATLDCHARARPAWRASAGDMDTGCPPSIVAQLIVAGVVAQPGVWPPELAVPVAPFFRELRRRGLRFR